MVENIDDNMGRVLAKLEQLKIADDTMFIFLTDNGPNGARYNANMKGRKGSAHEGGVRDRCSFDIRRALNQIQLSIQSRPISICCRH